MKISQGLLSTSQKFKKTFGFEMMMKAVLEVILLKSVYITARCYVTKICSSPCNERW